MAVLEELVVVNVEESIEVAFFQVPAPEATAPPSRRGPKIAAAGESIERANE